MTISLEKTADQNQMIDSVIIEKPLGWMKNKDLGQYVSSLYAEIYKQIKIKNIKAKNIDIFIHKSTDNPLNFYNRTPTFDNNTIYLSYHTYGEQRHNLWRIKESYIPGYFSIDSMGYSGFSYMAANQRDVVNSINIDINAANKSIQTIKEKLFKKNQSKYPQPIINNNFKLQNYLFFPLQIAQDTVISLSYFDYYELILLIAKNITNYPIVIKPHPRDKNKELANLLEDLAKINKNIIISHSSIHELIPNSLCCITINSGVGFESLLLGKPVIAFGKSDYDSCTTVCSDKKDITNNIIQEAIEFFDKDYVTKFVYYYLNYYCLSTDNLLSSKLDKILSGAI